MPFKFEMSENLKDLAKESNISVRIAAMNALLPSVFTPKDEITQEIRQLVRTSIEDSNSAVRLNIIKWILQYTRWEGDAELAPLIIKSLNDKNEKIRKIVFKPIIELLRDQKRFGWYKNSWKPKSFLFECLVYDYATNSSIDSIPKAIEGFFWFIHNKYKAYREANRSSPFISDIGGTGNDVAKKWTYQEFSNFMDEVYRSWSLSYNALKSQNETESIEKWRQLLGESFPLTI